VTLGRRLSAIELVDVALDDGSFVRWDSEPVTAVTDEAYAAELDRARERSGLDEAVITGEGMIRGRRVALVACEFTFLAGSIGVAAAERLVVAVERATAEGLPCWPHPSPAGPGCRRARSPSCRW
jgi:acetyl-CoA carboxylase beta subunit